MGRVTNDWRSVGDGAQTGMTNEMLDNDQWLRMTAIYESRVLTAVGGRHTPCRAWGAGRALGTECTCGAVGGRLWGSKGAGTRGPHGRVRLFV